MRTPPPNAQPGLNPQAGPGPQPGPNAQPDFAGDDVVDGCTVCGRYGVLKRTRAAIRETYECPTCRSSLRYRAQAAAILEAFADQEVRTLVELFATTRWRSLDIYEPGIVGSYRKYLKTNPRYVQSFYWPDVPLGQSRNGMRCEDLMQLTFADASFDLVITSDIFEHIRKPAVAFRELRRILRPGGWHIFTVPAQEPFAQRSVARVDTSTSEDVLILPAVYHGSGDGGKSLVYNDFGQDLLDTLNDLGMPSKLHAYRMPDHAKPDVYTFISTRP